MKRRRFVFILIGILLLILVFIIFRIINTHSIRLSKEWRLHNQLESGYALECFTKDGKCIDITVDDVFIDDQSDYAIVKYEIIHLQSIEYKKIQLNTCGFEALNSTDSIKVNEKTVQVQDLEFTSAWKFLVFGPTY